MSRFRQSRRPWIVPHQAVVNEQHQTRAQVTQNEGESTEIQIWNGYRLMVSPTVLKNGDVRLSMQLHKFDGDEYVQVAQPLVVTPDNEVATIRSAWEDGDSINIEITPRVQ